MSTVTSPSTSSLSIPILLFKSPSPTPQTDPYTTHLTTPIPSSPTNYTYTPHYIPVLRHSLLPDALISLLTTHLQSPHPQTSFPYGALLLTSQRAAAALSTALTSPPLQNRLEKLRLLDLDFYTVGPATEKAVVEIREKWGLRGRVWGGEKAGSGEVLGRLMLGDGEEGYMVKKEGSGGLKPLLFLTGEKRRDVLPRMLMDERLGEGRVQVDEMVVYETGELEEFEFGLGKVLKETETGGLRWVVVFSPTGGKGLLRSLGWLDEPSGRVKSLGARSTFVATIGPTTREYLQAESGLEADVVADSPSPKGLRDGIERFMREKGF